MNTTQLSSEQSEESIKYVCGIDMGSQSCSGCIMKPKKEMVVKPITFANRKDGWRKLLVHVLIGYRWWNSGSHCSMYC